MNVLLIDLDNTLIDRASGFETWATTFLRARGRPDSGDELAWLRSIDEDGDASRTAFFEKVRARLDLIESVETLVEAYRNDLPRLIPPPTGDTLAALRMARENGYKVCIVTNGGRDMQRRKISPDLAQLVDGRVISDDVGVRKPDPAILRAAAASCGEALTASSWMIGDRPETDVLCAWRAGIRSAWISRGRDWDDRRAYRPTIEAATLAGAIGGILSSMRADPPPAPPPRPN
jgi:putative hydrolase of the HAD superfamily